MTIHDLRAAHFRAVLRPAIQAAYPDAAIVPIDGYALVWAIGQQGALDADPLHAQGLVTEPSDGSWLRVATCQEHLPERDRNG